MPNIAISTNTHRRLKVHAAIAGKNLKDYLDEVIPELPKRI